MFGSIGGGILGCHEIADIIHLDFRKGSDAVLIEQAKQGLQHIAFKILAAMRSHVKRNNLPAVGLGIYRIKRRASGPPGADLALVFGIGPCLRAPVDPIKDGLGIGQLDPHGQERIGGSLLLLRGSPDKFGRIGFARCFYGYPHAAVLFVIRQNRVIAVNRHLADLLSGIEHNDVAYWVRPLLGIILCIFGGLLFCCEKADIIDVDVGDGTYAALRKKSQHHLQHVAGKILVILIPHVKGDHLPLVRGAVSRIDGSAALPPGGGGSVFINPALGAPVNLAKGGVRIGQLYPHGQHGAFDHIKPFGFRNRNFKLGGIGGIGFLHRYLESIVRHVIGKSRVASIDAHLTDAALFIKGHQVADLQIDHLGVFRCIIRGILLRPEKADIIHPHAVIRAQAGFREEGHQKPLDFAGKILVVLVTQIKGDDLPLVCRSVGRIDGSAALPIGRPALIRPALGAPVKLNGGLGSCSGLYPHGQNGIFIGRCIAAGGRIQLDFARVSGRKRLGGQFHGVVFHIVALNRIVAVHLHLIDDIQGRKAIEKRRLLNLGAGNLIVHRDANGD